MTLRSLFTLDVQRDKETLKNRQWLGCPSQTQFLQNAYNEPAWGQMPGFCVPKEALLEATWSALAARWWQRGFCCGISTPDAADTRSTTHRSRTLRCPHRKNPAQEKKKKENEKCKYVCPSVLQLFYLDAIFMPGGHPDGEEGRRDGQGHPTGGQDGGAQDVTQWKTMVGFSHPWHGAGQARAAPEPIAAWKRRSRVQQSLHPKGG